MCGTDVRCALVRPGWSYEMGGTDVGVVYYQGKKVVLLAATLRPETMYGQTNCWVLARYLLRAPGTDEGYCPTCCPVLTYGVTLCHVLSSTMMFRLCYAVSGTETGYAATRCCRTRRMEVASPPMVPTDALRDVRY
eukprot:2008393-Rhodomonas_salina.3